LLSGFSIFFSFFCVCVRAREWARCLWKRTWKISHAGEWPTHVSWSLCSKRHWEVNVLIFLKHLRPRLEFNTPFACWFFFWVDPGQPIWPVTRSLDRVDHRVGFQNYDWPYRKSLQHSKSSCICLLVFEI